MSDHASPSRQRRVDAALALLYLPLVAYLVSQGPVRAIDSIEYWEMRPSRAPLYSLFLQPFLRLGPLHLSWALLATQLAMGAASIAVLCGYLHRRFQLPFWCTWLLSILLAAPYVGDGFGNQILSEALAYPLFLVLVRFLVQAALDHSIVDLAVASVLTIPLVLTRGQFLFLYPVLGLLCAWMYFALPSRRPAVWRASLLLVCCIAATNLLERSYFLVRHGRFVTTPFTGIQLAALPFYVATASDAGIFEDDELRAYFETSFATLTRKKLTSDSFMASLMSPDGGRASRGTTAGLSDRGRRSRASRDPSRTEGPDEGWRSVGRPPAVPDAKRRSDAEQLRGARGFRMDFRNYAMNYNTIVHQVLKRRPAPAAPTELEIDKWIEIDEAATSTSIALIRANPGAFSKFLLTNLLWGLGRRQFAPFFLVLIALAAHGWRRYGSSSAKLVVVAGLTLIVNSSLVALVEPTYIVRYTVYGDVLLAVSTTVALFCGIRALGSAPTRPVGAGG